MEMVRLEPIRSMFFVHMVRLVDPTAGREGVLVHNNRPLRVCLRAQAFQTLDLPSPGPLNVSID